VSLELLHPTDTATAAVTSATAAAAAATTAATVPTPVPTPTTTAADIAANSSTYFGEPLSLLPTTAINILQASAGMTRENKGTATARTLRWRLFLQLLLIHFLPIELMLLPPLVLM
jgi:hypothetical protein